jgi:hypothetical protein
MSELRLLLWLGEMNDDVLLTPIPLLRVLLRMTLDATLLPDPPGMYLFEPPGSLADLRKVAELLLFLI